MQTQHTAWHQDRVQDISIADPDAGRKVMSWMKWPHGPQDFVEETKFRKSQRNEARKLVDTLMKDT